MHKRTLITEPHIAIHLDMISDILHVTWTGHQTEDTVKDGCEKMLKHVVSTKTSKVINDHTLVSGNWSGLAEWGAKIWLPALHKAGVKYFAWVLSIELYSQRSSQETLKYPINGILILTFEEKASAENWLKAM
ncbi:hypothetical protein [Rufibacter roseolus]|uniref:hypothetical protein n=1 Tax=Rufibacter roseolus TaxID=2817375 RepID=UPI001B311B02|nr:hypothetical protein [Rufibacter roseolus]